MTATEGIGLAVLRVALGVIFLMHGYLGFDVGPDGIAGYTTRMGYPASLGRALGWYLIVAHSIGGVLLIVGFLTRWAALAQLPIRQRQVMVLRFFEYGGRVRKAISVVKKRSSRHERSSRCRPWTHRT
jgi:hypothetical protein